ncbi:hypothetical protein lerEdw1_002631 [Lerista edwardsae]|nr:hypothetical protein lerEdw1_002631 [Lerista edwardsae]
MPSWPDFTHDSDHSDLGTGQAAPPDDPGNPCYAATEEIFRVLSTIFTLIHAGPLSTYVAVIITSSLLCSSIFPLDDRCLIITDRSVFILQ